MLISTPQGQMVAPLLEQMGATKAIPLSTSSQPSQPSQPSSIPSHTSDEMDMSCLSPWNQFNVNFVLSHLQQYSSSSTTCDASLIKLCYFLVEKNKKGEPCFSALKQSIPLLAQNLGNDKMVDILFDFLYLLAYNFPIIIRSMNKVKTIVLPLLSQFITLCQQVPSSSPLFLSILFCLSSLLSTSYNSELLSHPQFSPIFQSVCNALDREKTDLYYMSMLFLANIGASLPSRGENDDPSDEVLALLNALSDGICEEDNKGIMQLRIAGLYGMIKNGGMLEKVTLQSQGVSSDASIRVEECQNIWNLLVKVCESCIVCFHVAWFLD